MTDITFTKGLVAFFVSLIFYPITLAIYNLYFHPLSSLPGPILWRAFQFPYLSSLLSGRLPYAIQSLHSQYGPVVRVAPNELSFIDPDAWKDIYSRKEFRRPPQWGSRPPGTEVHNLISAPVAEHTRFRRALAPAFSSQAVKAQEPLITSYVDTLIQKLRMKVEGQSNETVVDFVSWINFTTFDIISDLGWGTSFRGLEHQEYHPWITVILQFKAILIGSSIGYYPLLNALVPYVTPKSALAGLNLVFGMARENVQARLKMQTERPDVMSFMEKGDLTEEEIVSNSTVLIVAGSETLTTALVGTMHHLLENSDKLERLVKEVRGVFENEKDIDGQTTTKMTYLTAVLQEGMRLCPPIPDNLHREVPAPGAIIAGIWLPGGTAVGVPCYSMFRSDENFERAGEFIPERWLEGEGFVGDKKDVFHPFGVGPSGCMGQPLAWVEMRMILARLLWNFDFKIPEGRKLGRWTDQDILWAWDKVPLNVGICLAARRKLEMLH